MTNLSAKLKEVVLKLHEIHALKFGDFKMKVGINSPVYFDLRVVVSHPKLMETISHLLWDFAKSKVDCEQLCGVPYTALPIATLVSVHTGIPMLIRRKEAKKYGTRKLIEGKFTPGEKCVIIEDVVTSGCSILETVRDLQKEGLEVRTAIVIVDREQGGKDNLKQHGISMLSMFTLTEILNILCEAGRVTHDTVNDVRKYIAQSQIHTDGSFKTEESRERKGRLTLSYDVRADKASNPVAAKLLKLMSEKKSNLCLAADVTSGAELVQLADRVGPHVCLLKTHIDIVEDFSEEIVKKLQDLAKKHKFLLLEDRKFADIGHTVSLQYSAGTYKISSWADLVTVHPVPGEGVLSGLKSALINKLERGCFLVTEMSSAGNLNTSDYIKGSKEMCDRHKDFVVGLVCQNGEVLDDPGLIQLTPGVHLGSKEGDKLGQQYNSPDYVVVKHGADIAVVGRGITQASDPMAAAKEYREQLWLAYKKRINSS